MSEGQGLSCAVRHVGALAPCALSLLQPSLCGPRHPRGPAFRVFRVSPLSEYNYARWPQARRADPDRHHRFLEGVQDPCSTSTSLALPLIPILLTCRHWISFSRKCCSVSFLQGLLDEAGTCTQLLTTVTNSSPAMTGLF